MPTLKTILSSAVEKLLFHPVTVISAVTVGERYRLLGMEGEAFRGVQWIPGQAVTIYLGNLTKRTYTPIDVNPALGSARFLIYQHGGGPGSTWASSLSIGDICRAMRPKRSLDFKALQGSVAFFGDETSIAAAQALQHAARDIVSCQCVLEVDSHDQAEVASRSLGLANTHLVARSAGDAHLEEVVQRLADASNKPTCWIFTGKATSIQKVRQRLKASGISLHGSRTHAYWSPGKVGME